jgi:hypothetical protein
MPKILAQQHLMPRYFFICSSCREHFGRVHDDFVRLPLLHAHRAASALAGELPEESDQFRFLHAVCLASLKSSVGLISAKVSGSQKPLLRWCGGLTDSSSLQFTASFRLQVYLYDFLLYR